MKRFIKDAIVIGAGPAGMAAAIALKGEGVEQVLLIERDDHTGGILNQCIHDGFGLVGMGKNYTGPEYAEIYFRRLLESGAEVLSGAMVKEIQEDKDSPAGELPRKKVIVQTAEGESTYTAGAVILATGCREKPRGALAIPGSRPAGIYTAGTAQNFVNLKNLLPGSRAVILGSGDIGLIMARRLTLEGVEILAVIEKERVPGGLPRNVSQCLTDFGIPLVTGATITNIFGKSRLTGVEVCGTGEDGAVLPGTSRLYECDTLILSVGLIPENEVGQTAGIAVDESTGLPVTDDDGHSNVEGVFICGNALFVHDLVDDVSAEGEATGRAAAAWLRSGGASDLRPVAAGGIEQRKLKMANRRKSVSQDSIVCILCPNSCEIGMDLKGAMCGRGVEYVKREFLSPSRTLTTSVRVCGGERPTASVRTSDGIPKSRIAEAMQSIRSIRIKAPVEVGQVVTADFLGTGVDLLTTCNVKKSVASE